MSIDVTIIKVHSKLTLKADLPTELSLSLPLLSSLGPNFDILFSIDIVVRSRSVSRLLPLASWAASRKWEIY